MSPHFPLAPALFLSRSPSVSVGEFKRPAFGHFFLFPRLFIPTGRMAASHGSLFAKCSQAGLIEGLKACPVRADQTVSHFCCVTTAGQNPRRRSLPRYWGWQRRAGEVFGLFS